MNPSTLSLNWQTVGGRRIGLPSPDFWRLWKRQRSEIERIGITVGQFDTVAGDYQLIWTPKSVVPEWVNEKLRDYQRPAVSTLVEGVTKWRRVFDGSDLGLGKTYAALATCATIGKQPFVICRKAAIPDWQRVGRMFGFSDLQVINYESLKTGKHLDVAQWTTGKSRNGRKFKKFEWFLPREEFVLVADEIHWCKAMTSQNSTMHIGSTMQDYQQLNLSATPGNQPMHFKALGFALGLHRLADFYPWLFDHGYCEGRFGLEFSCSMSTGERFEFINGQFQERPEAAAKLRQLQQAQMVRIHHDIFDSGKGVCLRKRDIPGFPKTQIVAKLLDFGAAAKAITKQYDIMREKLASAKNAADARGIMVRESMAIERLKMPTIANEVKAANETGLRMVVFLNYNESMDYLMDILKTDCVIRGDQSAEVRRANIDRFQENKEMNCLANSACGGESISLHDQTGLFPRGSIAMPSFWAEKLAQAFGRIDRSGVKDVTVQTVPFAANTIEVDMMENFERKCGAIESLRDGDLQSCLNL